MTRLVAMEWRDLHTLASKLPLDLQEAYCLFWREYSFAGRAG